MDYDATAKTALDAEVIKPRWYAWLDIVGDPLWGTTAPANVTFPANTPDPDLANKTFEAYHPDLVNVSEVKHMIGGAGTVTASLSGLVLPDNALLNIIANPLNWQGRPARFWQGIHDQTGIQQGAVVPYYGGFMSSLEINGDPDMQTITLVVESFTASMSRGSGRTYMDQERFDPLDKSAEAALATVNGGNIAGGMSSTGSSGGTSGVGGGGGGLLDGNQFV